MKTRIDRKCSIFILAIKEYCQTYKRNIEFYGKEWQSTFGASLVLDNIKFMNNKIKQIKGV